MKLFSTIFRLRGAGRGKKMLVTAAAFVALTGAGFAGVSALAGNKAIAGDCTANSIIKCGSPNRTSFINAVKASPQLQKIYAHFGLQPADYNRFITSARPGVAVKSNNTIVVDGRVVATGAWSIGRLSSFQGSGFRTVVIPGAGTFFGNTNDKAMAASTLPVDVLFDANGKMQFAVMTSSCGNPATGTVVSPTFACRALNSTAVSGQANTFNFTTDANAGSGATITKLVYNFGDGSATVTTSNATTVVKHTFTKSATVTVSVTVRLPDGSTVVLVNCKKVITVTPPPTPKPTPTPTPTPTPATLTCESLTPMPGTPDSTSGNTPFSFSATASKSDSTATITSFTFDFGDSSQPQVVNTSATSATANHTFAPGTFTTVVTVKGTDASGNPIQAPASTNCAQEINVKTPECKPGVPANSNECFTSTCDAFDVSQGNDRAVTITAFRASNTNTNATLSSIKIDWGDSNTETFTPDTIVNKTHTFSTDTSTITATAHFMVNGTETPAFDIQCIKKVSFVTPTVTPPAPPQVEAASTTQPQLVNTGVGGAAGLFIATVVVSTIGHRLYTARRLGKQN